MRVQIVDPSAQTPPFDRSLSAALARAGADVELLTSHFVHGPVAVPEGYVADEIFYPRSSRMPGGSLRRRLAGAVEHVPSMRRARRAAEHVDVVHYQWLTLPSVDARLLPKRPARVMTVHELPRSGEGGGSAQAKALDRMDAVVVLTGHGAQRLTEEFAIAPEKINVIPHGAFDYLTRLPDESPLLPELAGAEGPVILSFGLIRPYKGVDLLLRAFAELETETAELWIAGRPLGVDPAELHALADAAKGRVRFVTRFITDRELPAIFRRADIVALPYREAQQSGVLYAALAFGKAIVASGVGGLAEVARAGDGETLRLVEPGDVPGLAAALAELLGSPGERSRLEAAASAVAAGSYSWDAVAEETLELYRRLLSQ